MGILRWRLSPPAVYDGTRFAQIRHEAQRRHRVGRGPFDIASPAVHSDTRLAQLAFGLCDFPLTRCWRADGGRTVATLLVRESRECFD